jgi:hypothetical protein
MGIQNVLGVNYNYPDDGDKPWGTEHIAWATAVSDATNTLNAAIGTIPGDIITIQADITQLEADVLALQTDKVETSSNSGAGEGLALPKVGVDLPFKSITAGPNIVLTASATELNIDSVAAGTGDVVGPASSVDDRICTFDGITGKLIQDSGTSIATLLAAISAPNYILSTTCTSFNTTSTSDQAVTNLTVSITTNGGPVVLKIVSAGTTAAYIATSDVAAASGVVSAYITLQRNSVDVYEYFMLTDAPPNPKLTIPTSSVSYFDTPAAGTYTYRIRAKMANSGTNGITFSQCKLLAYEVK